MLPPCPQYESSQDRFTPCLQHQCRGPVVSAGSNPPCAAIPSKRDMHLVCEHRQKCKRNEAWMVRLFGASGQDRQARLTWSSLQPKQVWRSDLSEKPKARSGNTVTVRGWELVTLRARAHRLSYRLPTKGDSCRPVANHPAVRSCLRWIRG